jgi:glycosyltransferase involved in cell wall biosynthesis
MRWPTPWLERCVRGAFWRLPAALRERLHGWRHTFVRRLRRRRVTRRPGPGDIDFAAFAATVLPRARAPLVIFEPHLDWYMAQPQRPHHMARALARLGCLVVYRTFGAEVAGLREVEPRLWLCSDAAADALPGAVRCFYSTSLHAHAGDLLAARRRGAVVYDYIDCIDPAICGGAREARRLHALCRAALGGGADLVVSSARALHAQALAERGASACVYVPNGVDVAHYRAACAVPRRVATPTVGARKRVVGYFGVIAPWLWFEAIDELAARMPDVDFVFYGADYGGSLPRLSRRSNVHHRGAIDYAQLPGAAAGFDVCLIPFRPGEIARTTSPLKLYEYFALEKPVVVTADLRECLGHRGVYVGADPPSLERALRQALAVAGRDELRAALRAQAEAHDWTRRASQWLGKVRETCAASAGGSW